MSTDYPYVSIYITSYQQKAFLIDAIQSAVEQDYPKLEILIVDDGSTDGSVELIKSYQEKYPNKIRTIFNSENQGMIKTFNIALNACRGEYVMRLDGDDLLLPACVRKQVEFLRDNPQFVGCYHNIEVFDSASGNNICLYINPKRPAREGTVRNVIRYGCFFHGVFTIIKRSATLDILYRDQVRRVCDYYFMIEVLMKDKKIGYLNQTLARYRIHGKNITSNKFLLARDTLIATAMVIWNYPRFTFDALFRIYDAARAVVTKRNDWLYKVK